MKKKMIACLILPTFFIAVLTFTGCFGEEEGLVAEMETLDPDIFFSSEKIDGEDHVIGVGIRLVSPSEKRKNRLKNFLPQLAKFKYLRAFGINSTFITDAEISTLPPLPNVIDFYIRDSPNISDSALANFASMKKVEEIDIVNTNLKGTGFEYLKGFAKLKRLNISGSPIDDLSVPHMVANFPNLEYFAFEDTKITPEGWMQLASLKNLEIVSLPKLSSFLDYEKAPRGPEKDRLWDVEKKARIALRERFESAQKAANK